MVVVGTALLHHERLGMCHEVIIEPKKPHVSRTGLTFIIKVSAAVERFSVQPWKSQLVFSVLKSLVNQANNGVMPKRAIVFRSTGQDGFFEGKSATRAFFFFFQSLTLLIHSFTITRTKTGRASWYC